MASVPFKMQPLLRNILTLVVIIVFISQIDAMTTLVGRYGKFRDVFSISPNNLFGSFFRQIPNFESVLCIFVEGY